MHQPLSRLGLHGCGVNINQIPTGVMIWRIMGIMGAGALCAGVLWLLYCFRLCYMHSERIILCSVLCVLLWALWALPHYGCFFIIVVVVIVLADGVAVV